MNHHELIIEPHVIGALVDRTPLCPTCDSHHLILVAPDESGQLDINVVLGHEPACPKATTATETRAVGVTPDPYPVEPTGDEPSVVALAFRMGHTFGVINAKLDAILNRK